MRALKWISSVRGFYQVINYRPRIMCILYKLIVAIINYFLIFSFNKTFSLISGNKILTKYWSSMSGREVFFWLHGFVRVSLACFLLSNSMEEDIRNKRIYQQFFFVTNQLTQREVYHWYVSTQYETVVLLHS